MRLFHRGPRVVETPWGPNTDTALTFEQFTERVEAAAAKGSIYADGPIVTGRYGFHQTPDGPPCPTCGVPMVQHWTKLNFSYNQSWVRTTAHCPNGCEPEWADD